MEAYMKMKEDFSFKAAGKKLTVANLCYKVSKTLFIMLF